MFNIGHKKLWKVLKKHLDTNRVFALAGQMSKLQLAEQPKSRRVFVIDKAKNRLVGVYNIDSTGPPIQAVVEIAVYATSNRTNITDVVFLREDSLCQEFQQQCATATDTMRGVAGRQKDIHLTRREHEVLNCVVVDKSNKEIAFDLSLSERTVKFHVSSLLQKYHVQRRGSLTHMVSSVGEAIESEVKP